MGENVLFVYIFDGHVVSLFFKIAVSQKMHIN